MTKSKLLKKYNSVENLKYLKTKLNNRFKKHAKFGNKISLSVVKYTNFIDYILNNKENFVKCDICLDLVNELALTKDVDGDLICDKCLENDYNICNRCGGVVYTENSKFLYNDLFCKSCYFIAKDELIGERKIKNELLKNLQVELKEINYKKLSDYEFIIKNNRGNRYNFNINRFNSYRLGSWGANFWVDLTSKEQDLLKAIDFVLENSFSVDEKLVEIQK